jgi:hypothetical protein
MRRTKIRGVLNGNLARSALKKRDGYRRLPIECRRCKYWIAPADGTNMGRCGLPGREQQPQVAPGYFCFSFVRGDQNVD